MKDYIVYECMRCKQVFAIPLEHLKIPQNKDRHLSCNYGHRQIKELNEYDSIKECMGHSHYKRNNGAMKQID